MSAFAVRELQPPDDLQLRKMLYTHMLEDTAWPPRYAHQLDIGHWLAAPADMGRWVAVDAEQERILGHIGLGRVRGPAAEQFARATGQRPEQFAELCRAIVDPDARGIGVSSALTRKALKSALDMRRIPVATVLTGRGSWLQMMRNTGWQQVGDIEARDSDERLVLLLAPQKFIDVAGRNGR